ncbi:hypothetical protein LMG28688_05545 [Paraburkholderia caffeinitolerans]|uniref:AraC-type arabinose-binding/dimerisation domain-containing protein n=1 Tax=Paraburkholderia caffeinitolerans TaxID=1723730 RepID=A0A6J5GNM1_9BURK|nr:hypothetical protein LMG28688_05545 [Paraburkholderia caffeinitolerans]
MPWAFPAPSPATPPRGHPIEPHSHTWAQVLYAVSGIMWVEAGREALVAPPQRAVWCRRARLTPSL